MRIRLQSRTVVLIGAIAIAAAVVACPSHAAPVGGPLAGKELSIANEVRSGLESLAGGLLGGDIKGQVTRAVVDEDAPRRLTVRVTYEGFQGGTLWGELLNRDRRRQSGIAMGEPVSVSDASGEIVLTFEAEPGGNPTRSALLRISVAAQKRHTPSYLRSFNLGKEWSASEISGENFSVTITPQPIGRTAELGAIPAVVVPRSSVRSNPTLPASREAVGTVKPLLKTRSILPSARFNVGASGKQEIQASLPAKQIPASRIDAVSRYLAGLNSADSSLGAQGPGALPLKPFGDVRTEDIDLDLTRVLNVFPDVYQDQKQSLGIYYFLPQGYSLKWDAGEGYQFRTVYSSATQGAAGQVMMAARIDGGIGQHDLEIAAKIVRAHVQARGLVFSELRALPIDTLSVSLSNSLGQYSIPPEKISAHGLSDITGQLDVSWVTDERTKDFIQQGLIENIGINGSVTYAPTGKGLAPISVPIRMLLADYTTFGPFRWDRSGWKNTTPYPITLRYLHALTLATGSPPVVHSWGLGDTRVPPGGQVRWAAGGVPFWLDSQAQKMWLDYTVDQTCKSCGTTAIAGLTGGVSSAGSSQFTFHSFTPLAATGAHDILVEVRSRYFDPRGAQMQMRSFVVDADEKDFLVGPVFVGDRLSTASDPLFKFRLALTMKNGEVFTGNAAWISGETMRVPIGQVQIERSIGTLPGH